MAEQATRAAERKEQTVSDLDYEIRGASYVGSERYSFQGNTPANILGLAWVQPKGKEWRLCLILRYPDGRQDYAPLQEAIEAGYIK